VDTGGFYAALALRDVHHADAVAVLRRASDAGTLLVTAKWTVVETHALLLARLGRRAALAWLDAVPATVLPVSAEDEARALRILRSHRDKDFTLVDAAAFALMERTGVVHYLSYDRHFRQYGRFVPATPALL
jgi:predicted nucleic acid-binding protein